LRGVANLDSPKRAKRLSPPFFAEQKIWGGPPSEARRGGAPLLLHPLFPTYASLATSGLYCGLHTSALRARTSCASIFRARETAKKLRSGASGLAARALLLSSGWLISG
jgi:hypothetical protein